MTRSAVVLAALAVLLGLRSAHALECGTESGILGKQINGTFHLPAGELRLPKNCTFRAQVVITRSNTTLDCNGSTFDGSDLAYRTIAPKSAGARAIIEHANGLIVYAAPGSATRDVVIRNCVFQNYGRDGHYKTAGGWAAGINHRGGVGINISAGLGADVKSDTEHQGTFQVIVENSIFRGNVGGGVYIRPNVRDVTIRGSTFERNQGVAIYVELANRVTIEHSRFEKNGWKGKRRVREAIAIDSSRDNLIVDNTFRNSGSGGIFLYRNCGEFGGPTRWQGSDNNSILRNTFANEPRGIWVASRQSIDLKAIKCSDKPLDQAGTRYHDYADGNRIEQNRFCDVSFAITVEGSNNVVKDNRLAGEGTVLSVPVSVLPPGIPARQLENVQVNNLRVPDSQSFCLEPRYMR